MAKTKKKVKAKVTEPKKLSSDEVLEAESRSTKVVLLNKDTELKKSLMDKLALQKRVLELEVALKDSALKLAGAELKLHGDVVMSAEESRNQYLETLCSKYGVSEIAYDPDTLLLIKGDAHD